MDTDKINAILVKLLKTEEDLMHEKIDKVLDVHWVHYLKRKQVLLREFDKLGKNSDVI